MSTVIRNYSIDLDPNHSLGTGSFGTVYVGTHQESQSSVAVKCIVPKNSKEEKLAEKEIECMSIKDVKDHPNILSIQESSKCLNPRTGNNTFWLFLPFCDLGNLDQYALDYDLHEDQKLYIMRQISSAVAHLHGLKPVILHRDIKPENILLHTEGERHVVKLADFGVSKVVETVYRGQAFTIVGAPPYMAPEMFSGEDDEDEGFSSASVSRNRRNSHGYDEKLDVWSCAIMFYEMIQAKFGMGIYIPEITEKPLGKIVWKNRHSKTAQQVIVKSRHDSQLTQEIKAILEDMVALFPFQRLSMQEVESKLVDLLKRHPQNQRLPKKSDIDKSTKPSRSFGAYFDQSKRRTQVTVRKPKILNEIQKFTEKCTKTLEKEVHYTIGFTTHAVIAEGPMGCIDDKCIFKLLIQEYAKSKFEFVFIWEKECDMCKGSEKIILSNEEIVLRNGFCCEKHLYTTSVYSKDLELKTSTDKMRPEDFLGAALLPDQLIYCRPCGDQYALSTFTVDHDHVRTLIESVTSELISACRHDRSWWFAICYLDGANGHSMDIYTSTGHLHKSVELPFAPLDINALASVSDCILIAGMDRTSIYIYNWDGNQIGRKKINDIGLPDRWIWGIGPGPEGHFQMATGPVIGKPNRFHLIAI